MAMTIQAKLRGPRTSRTVEGHDEQVQDVASEYAVLGIEHHEASAEPIAAEFNGKGCLLVRGGFSSKELYGNHPRLDGGSYRLRRGTRNDADVSAAVQ